MVGGGYTSSVSEAFDKKMWHRRNRHKERLSLVQSIRTDRLEDHITAHEYEVSNPWSMSKDGKRSYFSLNNIIYWMGAGTLSLSHFISRRDRYIRKFLFK